MTPETPYAKSNQTQRKKQIADSKATALILRHTNVNIKIMQSKAQKPS